VDRPLRDNLTRQISRVYINIDSVSSATDHVVRLEDDLDLGAVVRDRRRTTSAAEHQLLVWLRSTLYLTTRMVTPRPQLNYNSIMNTNYPLGFRGKQWSSLSCPSNLRLRPRLLLGKLEFDEVVVFRDAGFGELGEPRRS